jgi:hypothetical protein
MLGCHENVQRKRWTALCPMLRQAQMDGVAIKSLRLPQHGAKSRQSSIQIDRRTLTKATRPRTSAWSAFSAVKKGIYLTLASQLSEVSGDSKSPRTSSSF